MKELKFLKQELAPVRDILLGLKLKGKSSRLRMKLVREINTHIEEFTSDEKQLFEEYVLKGKDGEPLKVKKEVDGEIKELFDFDDEPKFLEELQVLHTESISIEADQLKDSIEVILDALDQSEDELSGLEALSHDLLYEKLEKAIP